MSHYFSNDYQKSNRKKFEYNFLGHDYIFNTDDNVFSKSEVDFGSEFLAQTIMNDAVPSGSVLDIGCGYGTISIFLAKNSEAQFTACDVNERAVELCTINAKDNGLKNIVALVSDVCDNIEQKNFDIVVSNPPIRAGNKALDKFFNQSYEVLKKGGISYWVFRKQQGAETYTKKLKEIYGNAEVLDKKKSFWIVKCVKN